MSITRSLLVVLFAAISSLAFSQDNGSPLEQSLERNRVVFDPLFWKDRLRLDNHQCQRIREINSSFYRRLSDAVGEPNRQAVQAKAAQTLLERSEEIWATFHPRQRRIWKKISQEVSI